MLFSASVQALPPAFICFCLKRPHFPEETIGQQGLILLESEESCS